MSLLYEVADMKKNYKSLIAVILIALAVMLSACQSYERQVAPIKLPSAYPNATEVAGATIAAKSYDDKKEAEAAYGFDIVGAGVVPIQVVFDNGSAHTIEVVPSQTFLVDVDNNIWPILDSNLAYERIAKKTEFGKIAPEAAKGGVLAGIGGAMIGAAIGIVAGSNVGDAALKGAALGAAAGAVAGGVKGYANRDAQDKIGEDLRKKSLENKSIPRNQIAYGFLFFPGESAKAKELRLRIKETDTGISHVLIMRF